MYYEDFEPDTRIISRTRVVTGTDIDLFTAMTGALNPLFLSDEAAQATGQRARLTPGPLQFSLTIGLCYQAGLFDHIFAMAGVKELSFFKPVHPGDAVTAVTTLLDKRPTSKADRGLVVLKHELIHDNGEAALSAEVAYLMRYKPSG